MSKSKLIAMRDTTKQRIATVTTKQPGARSAVKFGMSKYDRVTKHASVCSTPKVGAPAQQCNPAVLRAIPPQSGHCRLVIASEELLLHQLIQLFINWLIMHFG